MFKKANRLTKKEFDVFYKTGKKHHLTHLTIITSPNEITKTAVVVGKKVSKSAVRRNTIKRRVSSILRKSLSDIDATVFIVIIKPSFNSLPRKTAEEFVQQSIAEVTKSA